MSNTEGWFFLLLSSDEKLRLVSTLVQQVMTYAAVRDIVEDSYDKLRVKKYDLKLLQWAEVRRLREDQVAQCVSQHLLSFLHFVWMAPNLPTFLCVCVVFFH